MQFSKAAEYALLGLTYLARENHAASVGEIARAEKLSLYFLRNVFQKLRGAKLVESNRGRGFALAKKAQQISLKNVLDAVEQNTTLHACLQNKSCNCARAAKCKIIAKLTAVQKNLDGQLAKIRITDLI
jgi:Rrf2 family protein